MPKLIVLTTATKDSGYFKVLIDQVRSNNIEYNVIGYGEKWGGWIWRTNKILNELEKYDPDDIVMIMDGYDVLFLGDKSGVLDKYYKFNTDVVFGIEPVDTGNISYIVSKAYVPVVKYIFDCKTDKMKNGGSMMGRVSSLIKIYKRMKNYCQYKRINDDQVALNNIYLGDIDYQTDNKGEIFWIWHVSSLYELLYGLVYGYLPGYNCEFSFVNDRVQFDNGVQPEVIHGVYNRDMTSLVKNKYDIEHEITKDGTLCIVIFVLLVLMCIIYLLFFNYMD